MTKIKAKTKPKRRFKWDDVVIGNPNSRLGSLYLDDGSIVTVDLAKARRSTRRRLGLSW